MLLAGNTDLDTALKSYPRKYSVELFADWNDNGLYDHTHSDLSAAVGQLSYDRVAGNDLPEEVELIQGFHAGSLRVTLAGQVAGTPVVELFSAYQSTSPLAGKDLVGTRLRFRISVETATGPVIVPQFVGNLRVIDTSSNERDVEIEVLDLAVTLANDIDLPVASRFAHERWAQRYPPTTPQWVVDHVLRRNGIYLTPAPAQDAILSVTGHGGLGAEIGANGVTRTTDANTIEDWNDSLFSGVKATASSWGNGQTIGAFGLDTDYACTRGVDLKTNGTGFAVAMWMNLGATMTKVSPAGERKLLVCRVATDYNFSPASIDEFLVTLSDTGVVAIKLYHSGGGSSSTTLIHSRQLADPESWRYFGIHIGRESSTILRATLRCGGATTSGTINPPSLNVADQSIGVKAGLYRPWSNLHAWLTPTAPAAVWPREDESGHVPQASVDIGRARLSHLPDSPGSSSVDVMKAVASAEYANFGFDEEGWFSFRKGDFPATSGAPTPDRIVTASSSLRDLGSERSIDSVRNRITSTVREVYYGYYGTETIFALEDPGEIVAPVGVSTWRLRLERGAPLVFPTIALTRRATSGWDGTKDGFVPVQNGTTTELTNVNVKFSHIGPREGLLTVQNNHTAACQFKTTGGDPALRINGYSYNRQPEDVFTALDETSVGKFQARSWGIPPSEWRSVIGPYKDLAADLLVQLRKPVTTLKEVHMIGDPRDQIGDVHEIQDPDGIGTPIIGKVQTINRTWNKNEGLRQTMQYRIQRNEVANSYRAFDGLSGFEAVGPGSYTISHEFIPTSTVWVNSMWYYKPDSASDPSQMRIYRVESSASGTPVDGTWYNTGTRATGGWQQYFFAKPILLEVNQPYYACFMFNDKLFPNISSYWVSGGPGYNGIRNGPLFLPGRAGPITAVNGNACFISGATMQFPTQFSTGAENRGIDVTVVDTPY